MKILPIVPLWLAAALTLPLAADYTSMFVADVDRDGEPEIVATASNRVEVWKRVSGLFTIVATVPLGTVPLIEVTAGDLDGDGLPEIVVDTGYNTGGIVILRNLSR